MNHGALLAGALVLGAAGGFAAGILAPPSATAPPPTAGDPAASSTSPDSVARLEGRLDELAAAVAARSPGTAPAAGEATAPADGAPPAPEGEASPEERLADLEKRIAALERRGGAAGGPAVPEDLSKTPTAELEALTRSLMQHQRHGDLLRVAEELAKRGDLTPDQRVDAEMSVGYGLRGLGKHAEAEARFRETLARTDPSSDKAPWLGFQIAWQRFYQKDFAGGSVEMERSANHPSVSAVVRVHSLYNAANFARESGDNARARGLLERLLQQHGDDIPATQPHIRQGAEQMLKQITGN